MTDYPDFSDEFIKTTFSNDYMPLETSRGCYWNACSFCSVIGRDRQFSVEWILRMIEKYAGLRAGKGYRPKIFFFDSNYQTSQAQTVNKTAISGGTATITTVASEVGQWMAVGI